MNKCTVGGLTAGLLALLVCQPLLAGPTIRVSQESSGGAGDFTSNIVGYIEAYDTALSASAYYNASPNFSGPAPTLVVEESHLFLVNASNGLYLFIVHDAPNNKDGGHAEMRFEIFGDPEGAAIGVRDDAADTYTGAAGTNVFTSRHNWPNTQTDGLTLGSLNGNFSVLAQFTAAVTGLGCWTAHSANGTSFNMALETGRRVRLDIIPELPCPQAQPDAGCANFPTLRSGPFPPAGLDDFATGAAFKVKFLDGSEVTIANLQDPHTIIGRSDPHYDGSPADIAGVPIAGAGQPPYQDLPSIGTNPCTVPSGFPESTVGGREVHTQMLSLNLTNGTGDYVRAGQPYFDTVRGTSQERFFQPSFGEVQGLGNDFPADSYFNVFVTVRAGPYTMFNKSPMIVRGRIDSFPPNVALPTSTYLHDPSFAAVPLIDANGVHVAYLMSAGHGAVNVEVPPNACDVETILSGTASFSVDAEGAGIFPTVQPNDVEFDQAAPAQEATVYQSSGLSPGAPPDVSNTRVPELVGSIDDIDPIAFKPGTKMTSFSFGRDGTKSLGGTLLPGALVFSVDRTSVGASCSDVRLGSPFGGNPDAEHASDLYLASIPPFGAYGAPYLPSGDPGSNTLYADQTVLGLRPLVDVTGQDNIMGLELSRYGINDRLYGTFVGPNFECVPFGNDCNSNGISDLCEQDCNSNLKADSCDIAAGTSLDVNSNGIPDECEPCGSACDPVDVFKTAWILVYDDLGDPVGRPFARANLTVYATATQLGLVNADKIDMLVISDVNPSGASPNGVRDAGLDEVLFSLAPGSPTLAVRGWSPADLLYSRLNGTASRFATAASLGLLTGDNIDAGDVGPVLLGTDCNCDGLDDSCNVATGQSNDCNSNGVPDECELAGNDCNCNNIPDECDLPNDSDCDLDGVPDTCEPDCNANGYPDDCDVAAGTSADCNGNGVPDECDPAGTLRLRVSEPVSRCIQPGEAVTVTLAMSCLAEPMRGFQAFIEYDNSILDFNGGTYLTGAFDRPILAPISTNGAFIDLAAGTDDLNGQQPTSANADLVSIQFQAGMTDGTTRLGFRCNYPPSRLVNASGQPVEAILVDTQTIVIDGTPPSITCGATINASNDPGSCGATVGVDPATADDGSGSGVVSIVPSRSDGQGMNDPFPVGTTTITWTATDCSGNSSSCTQSVVVTDTEDPAITCPGNVTGPNAALGTCSATVIVPTPTASDNCEVASVTNDFTGTGNASGVYPVGTTVVTWTVTDIYGNSTTCQHTVTVNDAQPPTISCPANIANSNDPGVCQGTVSVPSATANDNCPGVSVSSNHPSSIYPVGTTIVTWTATDVGGNTANCSHTVTVNDTEPPSITCPGTVTVSSDPDQCNAVVTVPNPTTSDNCGVATVTNSRTGTGNASGTYPVGTTPVTWTVVDIHGNPSVCTHNVVVLDNQAPDITCAPDVTTNADPGVDEVFVNVPGPTTADECGVASVVNDYNGTADASDIYPVGSTLVTWTVTDVNGNTNTCQQNVEVRGVNLIDVTVQLSPTVTGPFSRCITFEVFPCDTGVPVVIDTVMNFNASGLANTVIEAPFDVYDCITARDKLHTLRRTDEAFHISGQYYVADFTGNPNMGGDWLVGGNLNDDRFIDILDFGIFANQFAANYGSPDTTCATPRPHADVSGDGQVTLADFTFIQINFLKASEANCCALPGRAIMGEDEGPLVSIPTKQLPLYGLSKSLDLNRDGVLDQLDIVLFMQGERPQPDWKPDNVLDVQTEDGGIGEAEESAASLPELKPAAGIRR